MRVAEKVYESMLTDLLEPGVHVGKRLRALREVSSLSQAQVADRLNIGENLLSRIEARKDIQVSTLQKYLNALGLAVKLTAYIAGSYNEWNNVIGLDIQRVILDENQLELPIVGSSAVPRQRDVVFSIKPRYSNKIVEGEKTVELRRRFPMSVRAGTTAYIYATSPIQALLGMAEIGDVHRCAPRQIWNNFADRACVAREDFDSYFDGLDEGFAIELRQAQRLKRPVHLNELRDRFKFEPPQSFLYATEQMRKAFRLERS